MGGIQCINPATSVESEVVVERKYCGTFNPEIIRLRSYPKKDMRQGLRSKQICSYNELLAAVDVTELTRANLFPLNIMWFSGIEVQPGWNGFMNVISSKIDICDSTYIMAVPFINLDASNASTIYTALCYAAEQSRKQNQTCIVTFDQPLFLKASEIVASAASDSDISKIVLRLGGFHLLMSFMGCLGHIMEDSGLECLWATVYGSNTVQNMFNGHSYARCIRAYTLTASGIILILKECSEELAGSLKTLQKFHKSLLCHETNPDDIVNDTEVVQACEKINTYLNELQESSRTAKLWLNLLKCIDLIFKFIYAERTGNWALHMSTTVQMLPFFHAAGHLPYAKSAHLYTQEMVKIDSKLSARERELFKGKGMFTVRRNGTFYSGTWTDMCIEQNLMRPMKSVGGLTHGRGITESTLSKWVHGTPYVLRIQEALDEFLGTTILYSEQHVEVRESRIKRDQLDQQKFVLWLKDHNPFTVESGELVSLSNGCIADESVNCDMAYEVGMAAMNKIKDTNFGDLKLQRKDMVKTLGKSKQVKVRSKEVTVNPQQLFNRILCVCDSPSKLKEYLSFELAPRPPSLFDDVSLRKGTKSSIVKIFDIGIEENVDLFDANYVLDGGFLLHYLSWPSNLTYGEIIQGYCEYVTTNYGGKVKIIFDGYPEHATTKQEEQDRRLAKKTSCNIHFDAKTKCMTPKENFLGNKENKRKFVQALTFQMDKMGISTFTAEEDADVDIVRVALELINQDSKVVLVGSDTDLLVLLVALTPQNKKMYFCKPKGGRDIGKIFYNIETLVNNFSQIRRALLFTHSLTGCDTTSTFYGLGKIKAVEMLKSSPDALAQALMFTEEKISQEQLFSSGENFVLELYGLKKCPSLNEARYYKFTMMTKKSNLRSNFELAKLPPTTEACQQHLLRVYLQTQRWLGNNLAPTEWGWKLETTRANRGERKVLKPIMNSKPFAPNDLLYLVSCSCKSACGNYCSCRKSGLHCSPLCEHCSGLSCHNMAVPNEDEEDIIFYDN